jgi:ORF6N domain
MLDSDLADLYGVSTKALLQAVKRNPVRFLPDFMFSLTEQEAENLRSQIVTSSLQPRNWMRAFVRLRDLIGHNREMTRRLNDLESKYDRQFKVVFDAIRELMTPPARAPKRRIGFVQGD